MISIRPRSGGGGAVSGQEVAGHGISGKSPSREEVGLEFCEASGHGTGALCGPSETSSRKTEGGEAGRAAVAACRHQPVERGQDELPGEAGHGGLLMEPVRSSQSKTWVQQGLSGCAGPGPLSWLTLESQPQVRHRPRALPRGSEEVAEGAVFAPPLLLVFPSRDLTQQRLNP